MSWEGELLRIDENRVEIPIGTVPGMKTNAIIYADKAMESQIRADNAPMQAANVACLPGIVGSSLTMPDIHWGYGFPIGGVAAVDANGGCISPGGIGFDINCGVRLIRTDLQMSDVDKDMDRLMDALYANVPSGLGSKGIKRLTINEIDQVLQNGSIWAVENGYGWESDIDVTEERGSMESADCT